MERIPWHVIVEAQRETSRGRALPSDWSGWFPGVIFLELGIKRDYLTIGDVFRFALFRVTSGHDEAKYIEAAQSLALIHYLGCPDHDTRLGDEPLVPEARQQFYRSKKKLPQKPKLLRSTHRFARALLETGEDVELVLTNEELERARRRAQKLLRSS